MNLKSKNWKTSGAGLAAILLAVGAALTAITDTDPLTQPDWTATLAALIAGIGLLFARDGDKSSEQVGAK